MDMQDGNVVEGGETAVESIPRKKGISAWVWVVAVLALALVAAAVYMGLQQTTRVRAAEDKLETAVEMLAEVEDVVIAADEVVQAEITSDLASTAAEAQEQLPQARKDLSDAIELLVAARIDLTEDDQVLAQALQAAAEARAEMLQEAETILAANKLAAGALQPAADGWALVAEAEKLSQDAVVQYNKHTKEGVENSTKLSKEAVEKLAAARSSIETASVTFPDAELKQFIDYIDAREELLESSMKIDSTWLDGKLEDANDMLDAYSKQETALIAQGKELPASPKIAIADAYEALAAEPTDRYFAARDRARAADEKVQELSEALAAE